MKTINHEYYVSFEIAKLLLKAGFNWECWGCYSPKGKSQQIVYEWKPYIDDWNNMSCAKQCVSAPTIDVAQRWLREVKDIEVNVFCVYIEHIKKYSYTVFTNEYKHEIIGEGFDTHEEALEAGIKKALEIILEKGE